MSWNDLLAGLSGGLSGAAQGIGAVQDDRLKQAQQMLQKQRYDLEVEAKKRQAAMEARQLLSGGMKVQPELLNTWKDYPDLLAGIEKQADGSLMVAPSKQEQLIEQTIREHAMSVKEKQDQEAARDAVTAMGKDFFNLPDDEKLVWANKIGEKNFQTQTPEQTLQYNASLEKQKLASQTAADVARIRAQGSVDAANARGVIQRLAQQGKDQITYEDAVKLIRAEKDVLGQPIYKLGTKEFEQAVQYLMQQGQQHATAPATTNRWSNLQRIQ